MKSEKGKICRQAIATFGEESQKRMAVEECAELINALMKEPRGRVTNDEIITEIADVTIMVHQLAIMYGIEKCEAEIKRKLNRLNERINDQRIRQPGHT